MASLPINQDVNVHWRHVGVLKPDGATEGEDVVRTFINLIPACEFALAMSREGHDMIRLDPSHGPRLDVAQAQKIATAWETGKVELDATEVEI